MLFTFAADTMMMSSTDLMLLVIITLFVSAVVGFVSGIFYERAAARRALSRAGKHLSRLIEVVVQSLEAAQKACITLEKFPNLALSPKQLQRLESKQSSLLETVTRVVGSQQALVEAVAEQSASKPKPAEFEIDWQRQPEDSKSGIPDRVAFDDNLRALLAAGQTANVDSGLLLIKVDKFDQLQSRYGTADAEAFLRKVVGVVCRAGRDEDLLCRYSTDMLALLMPQVDSAAGRVVAQKIRDSVRSCRFRLDATGPEVLITASFGYTVCDPADNPDLVVNRAGNALAKSQRRGRNQLHLHDGSTPVHCLAG